MTALRNQPTTTTPERRPATLGARRTRVIVPDGFGAAQAVPDLTEVDRRGLGYDQVPHSAQAAGADPVSDMCLGCAAGAPPRQSWNWDRRAQDTGPPPAARRLGRHQWSGRDRPAVPCYAEDARPAEVADVPVSAA